MTSRNDKRIRRIEHKCDRIISELASLRRCFYSRSSDIDVTIERMHNNALELRRANTPLVSSTNCYIQRTVPLQSKWMVYARLMIAKSGSLQSVGRCGGGWCGFFGDILPVEGK